MAKIKIVGDGTSLGTRVEVDGELLEGVQSVRFSAGVHDKPKVILEIKRPLIDVEVDTQMGANLCLEHRPVQHRDGKPAWCRNCGEP